MHFSMSYTFHFKSFIFCGPLSGCISDKKPNSIYVSASCSTIIYSLILQYAGSNVQYFQTILRATLVRIVKKAFMNIATRIYFANVNLMTDSN